MSRVSGAGGSGDVMDFELGNGEGASLEAMSLERSRHLNDLIQRGYKALQENQLEQAIDLYSRADKIKPNDPIILGNRCSAYLMLSRFLLRRHPSASEDQPYTGLDPTSYAGFALKDAEKVMSLQSNLFRSYVLQAKALFLLERYDMAREVIRSGVQIDPQSAHLLIFQRSIPNTLIRRNRVIIHQHADDYDCTICLKLLYEPITTPCGHSFCRSCLFQSMDRGNRCPLCRTVLFMNPNTCSISVTLNNIIQKSFPEEYAERKSENDSVTTLRADFLPLYVMDPILPCQKFHLNISEPRYRLMVRRVMAGNRRMGAAVVGSSTNSLADYACELEITDCEPLPDGGFYLEVESRRRCRILGHWAQDGYRVAEVEWMQDDLPPEGTAERNSLVDKTRVVADIACRWLKWAIGVAQGEGDEKRLDELLETEGLMPPISDPERYSFWLCTLTEIMPSEERLDLLRTTVTTERLMSGLIYLRFADEISWYEAQN